MLALVGVVLLVGAILYVSVSAGDAVWFSGCGLLLIAFAYAMLKHDAHRRHHRRW
jgi:uncharacterized membrane protein